MLIDSLRLIEITAGLNEIITMQCRHFNPAINVSALLSFFFRSVHL